MLSPRSFSALDGVDADGVVVETVGDQAERLPGATCTTHNGS